MNQSTAFSEEVAGRFMGRFRLAWRSDAFPVRESRDGPIIYFDTALEAECAAWRTKHKIEEPKMRREGDPAGKVMTAANAVFRGGGKVIPIERRGRKLA